MVAPIQSPFPWRKFFIPAPIEKYPNNASRLNGGAGLNKYQQTSCLHGLNDAPNPILTKQNPIPAEQTSLPPHPKPQLPQQRLPFQRRHRQLRPIRREHPAAVAFDVFFDVDQVDQM